MAILQDRRSLNLRDPALAYLASWGEPSVFASGVRDNKLGGLGWGVEGIVRMSAGFEMIWCSFSSPSIRLLSHLNVTALLLPESLLSNEHVIGIDQDLRDESQILRMARPVPPMPCSHCRRPQQRKLIRIPALLDRQIGKNGRESHLQC
jgi:hypothetical protein